jgi:hypothetical protein
MHSCGVTRNMRKGYAIASFHSFGSSHGVECRDAAVRVAAEKPPAGVSSVTLTDRPRQKICGVSETKP